MAIMACTPEQIINKLREAEVHLSKGNSIQTITLTYSPYFKFYSHYFIFGVTL